MTGGKLGLRIPINFSTTYCLPSDALVGAYKRSVGAVQQGVSIVVDGNTRIISTGQSEGHLGYQNVTAPVRAGECFYIGDHGGGDSRTAWYMTMN